MSKAKDDYYELKKHLDAGFGGIVPEVSEYVTELEKKSGMFDEMIEALKKIYLDKNCNEFYKSRKLDELFDRMKSILYHAKKIQEAKE